MVIKSEKSAIDPLHYHAPNERTEQPRGVTAGCSLITVSLVSDPLPTLRLEKWSACWLTTAKVFADSARPEDSSGPSTLASASICRTICQREDGGGTGSGMLGTGTGSLRRVRVWAVNAG